MCAEKQILVIYAAVNGFCDRMPLDRIGLYERAILSSIKPELLQSLLLSLSNGGGKNKNVLGDDNLISLQTFLKESAAAAMVVINNLKKDNQSRLLFFQALKNQPEPKKPCNSTYLNATALLEHERARAILMLTLVSRKKCTFSRFWIRAILGTCILAFQLLYGEVMEYSFCMESESDSSIDSCTTELGIDNDLQPGGRPTPEAFYQLLRNHQDLVDLFQEIHREIGTHAPGGFQAERLADILESRHGGG